MEYRRPPTTVIAFSQYEEDYFYFAHSYYAIPLDGSTAAVTNYGITFASAAEQRKVFGVQFHPEKSASAGATLLAAFLEM